jgi:DNA-binding IclR family transcriptional regulator
MERAGKIPNPTTEKLKLAETPPRLGSRALAKGLTLLEYLGENRRPMPLAGLASRAGLGKASTLRLLNTLEEMGWLVREGAEGYRLDRDWPRAGAQSWLRRLYAAALPEMGRLNGGLAETITLAALLGDHIRVAEVLDSPHLIRMTNYKDRILPPYASSLGKAITAYRTPREAAALLQIYGTYRFTEHTLTDFRAIHAELASIRERGFSCDDQETVIGGVCFGAPIRSADGTVAAALSISLPRQRLTPEMRETLPAVAMEAARAISAALG